MQMLESILDYIAMPIDATQSITAELEANLRMALGSWAKQAAHTQLAPALQIEVLRCK